MATIPDPCPSTTAPAGFGDVHCHGGDIRTGWHVHGAGEMSVVANPNPAAVAGGTPAGGTYLSAPGAAEWGNAAALAGYADTSFVIPAMTEPVAMTFHLSFVSETVQVRRGRAYQQAEMILGGALAGYGETIVTSGPQTDNTTLGNFRSREHGSVSRVFLIPASCVDRTILVSMRLRSWAVVENSGDFGSGTPAMSGALRWTY